MARHQTIEALERRQLFSAALLFPHLSSGRANDRAIADLNGDSKADIVTASSDDIVIAFGDGTGEFPTRYKPTVPTGGYSNVVVADFNADGRLDVAACPQGIPEVVVVFQLATGFFGPAQR